MTNPERTNDWNRDVARVSQELASRLRSRGIEISEDDSPDDVAALAEIVEEFEAAVEDRGGDLMVDEPPMRGQAEPDDPRFLLPKRTADETVTQYIERLQAATDELREQSS